jgi:glyoxylase-like metal-dependent hydrolase (beta-lactamase superfamily II)
MLGMSHPIAFPPGGAAPLDLEVTWNNGTDPEEPPAQVHYLEEHTVVIRQSLRTSAEAPFVVLLFGNDRAFLLDTGDERDPSVWPLRRVIDELVSSWLSSHPREGYGLTVAHTHAHRDHIAGDSQFADRPRTTIVGAEVDDVREFFGLHDWPSSSATVDLGERRLVVVPSPGHHESAISVLDPYSGFLFSGDAVYPGRLYVPNMQAFLVTIDRLAELAESGDISRVLGCHIELDCEGRDYPLGVREHPAEESPFMPADRLVAIRDSARTIAHSPGVHRFDGFVIYNGNRFRDQVSLVVRSWRSRLRS